jgi:hypothetical protein
LETEQRQSTFEVSGAFVLFGFIFWISIRGDSAEHRPDIFEIVSKYRTSSQMMIQ